MKIYFLIISLFFSFIFGQSKNEEQNCVNKNKNLLIETTISIVSTNNITIYKPFGLLNKKNINIDLQTGINFFVTNLTESKADIYLEYDLLPRFIWFSNSFYAGFEVGLCYKYIVSNEDKNYNKIREKIGLILGYNLSQNWDIILKINGTTTKASTFGIGVAFSF